MGLVGSINQVYQIKAMGSNFKFHLKKKTTNAQAYYNEWWSDPIQPSHLLSIKKCKSRWWDNTLLHIQSIPINQSNFNLKAPFPE